MLEKLRIRQHPADEIFVVRGAVDQGAVSAKQRDRAACSGTDQGKQLAEKIEAQGADHDPGEAPVRGGSSRRLIETDQTPLAASLKGVPI